MSNPWALYDDLVAGISPDVTVADYQVGHIWTRVLSSDGTNGLAMTTNIRSRSASATQSLIGRPLRDVAQLVRSWNLVESSIGVAAINAWYNHPERMKACGYEFPRTGDGLGAFDTYRTMVARKKVATIGHFKFIEDRFDNVAELTIIEKNPRHGDYPDSASEYLLPKQDIIFITGSALVNKTLPRLLELGTDAHVIITGPTTPLSPVLYNYGADGLSGFSSMDSAALVEALRGAGRGAPKGAGIMVDFAKVAPAKR